MFPGSYPFEELAAALLRVAVERPEDVVEELARDELGIRRVVKQILPPGSELLLVVDQFEELFTLTADEETRRRFLAGLTALAADPHSACARARHAARRLPRPPAPLPGVRRAAAEPAW